MTTVAVRLAPPRPTLARPELKVRESLLVGYSSTLIANAAVGLLALLTAPDAAFGAAYPAILGPTGLIVIAYVYRRTRLVVTPLTLFAAVWMIAVPLTSSQAPLMTAMTSREVSICALAGLAFSAGGLLANLPPPRQSREVGLSFATTRRMTFAADFMLVASIAALLANIAIEGRIALFDVESEERKAVASFFGYPILASLGTISMVIYARNERTRALRIMASTAYIALQLLTGQRFVAVVALILIIVTIASTRQLARKDVRRIAALLVGVAAVFLFVSLFRGGASDQEEYFIQTGLYGGDPALLQWTEIVRYFGMSQRNMSAVFDRAFEPASTAAFSFAPLTALFGEAPTGLGTTIFGYTANSVIAYLFADFGYLWPAAVFALAIVTNAAFRANRRRNTYTSTFIWSVSALGIATSFFAYLNAYLYWVALFPLAVYFLERWATRGVPSPTSRQN